MSGLAVRAKAYRVGFLFVFLLPFSLCQMDGLERRDQEEEEHKPNIVHSHRLSDLVIMEVLVGLGNLLCKRKMLC